MSTKIAKEHTMESMRCVYADKLIEMADAGKNIVALEADLMSCVGTQAFQEEYPERMINCGVQEANMIGVAAGLSAIGQVPFAHSFGCFATRRCFDQIFISAAYAQLNVKIIGSDPGVLATYNGGTHMPFEDMGIMRVIPNAVLLEPVDAPMLKNLLEQAYREYGLYYIRLPRKEAVRIYEDGSTFEIGKGIILRDGSDATVIATGIQVYKAMQAADILAEQGISLRVVNMFTLKPIDKSLIVECAHKTGAIVTSENHNIINGLGSAVAEVLAEKGSCVPFARNGVQDRFGQVGSQEYLEKVYGLTVGDIVACVLKVISQKTSYA